MHRIVSLLPSATEITCALGLGDQLVAVSHECDFPPFVRQFPKVTRTLIPLNASSGEIDAQVRERSKSRKALYSLDMEAIDRLRPDMIVTQALCDVCAVAETEVAEAVCKLPGRPIVVNLEPTRLEEVFQSMRRVGEVAGVAERAEEVIRKLKDRVEAVAERSRGISDRPRVVLLEWIDPPFSCGHWSPELVHLAGGIEMIGRAGHPSRTTHWDEIVRADPEVLFIACCGFGIERTCADLPILAAYPGSSDLSCVRAGRVYVTDGSAYFSRPGPRLVDSLEILAHAIHPRIHPLPSHIPTACELTAVELGSTARSPAR